MEQKQFEINATMEQTHWWFTGRRAILDQLLTRHLTRTARLLEIGCGPGGNLPMLKQHGQVKALDPAPIAVEYARRTLGLDVQLGQLPDGIPPDLGQFDAVCLFDVLEHIDDDQGALMAVQPLLDIEGKVFITVPALPWLWSNHDQDYGHRRRYTRATLTSLVERAGFRLLHCSYFCSFLFPVIASLRLAGKVFGRVQNNDFEVTTKFINTACHTIFAAETPLVTTLSLPIGSSLLAVACLDNEPRKIDR